MEPSTAAAPGGGIAQIVILLVFTFFFVIPVRMLAKDKGRNITKWTILACIPVVNYFCLIYFVGAANLRHERKIDAILKVQGQDPQQFN